MTYTSSETKVNSFTFFAADRRGNEISFLRWVVGALSKLNEKDYEKNMQKLRRAGKEISRLNQILKENKN